MAICDICMTNIGNNNYSCCKKIICDDCQNQWYSINKTCPYCRANVVIYSENYLPNKFKKWLNENNINLGDRLENYLIKLLKINNIFKYKTDEVLLKVANLNLIHVFKYNSISEIGFKYHKNYNLVEITGGEYYLYGELKPSNVFGWWLHGFIEEATCIGIENDITI